MELCSDFLNFVGSFGGSGVDGGFAGLFGLVGRVVALKEFHDVNFDIAEG